MGLRSFGNKLGFAWWAKVETSGPNVTYWFGPFLTRRSLKFNLSSFLEDTYIPHWEIKITLLHQLTN